MTYEYYCDTCHAEWEERHAISERDAPLGKPCPHCKANTVKRGIAAPALSYQGSVSAVRKAGSGWNDVLKKVKKSAGKKSTVNHY